MSMLADCGKQHFWETTFAITSPHHPDNYEDNLRCICYVHNPFNGLITITFDAFDIEFRVDCDQDYLSVGIPSRRIFLARRCASAGLCESNVSVRLSVTRRYCVKTS